VVPYYVIAIFPHGDESDRLTNKDRRLGLDDNAWTNMAGGIAGFTVEPSRERFNQTHKGEEYIDITTRDGQAKWRFEQYRGKAGGADYKVGKRLDDFTFDLGGLAEDGNSAKAKSGATYPLRERTVEGTGGANGRPITEKLPEVFPGK
jgi:hypothetical protein